MTKKMMLLSVAAISAALLALPAIASAEEDHFDTATTFTGTGGALSIVAAGEPPTTCETIDITNGTISVGGTTGTLTFDFTGCHTTVFGLTSKCHTTGSALDNTIASGGTFHLITWRNASGTPFPAVLITLNTTEFTCAGISNSHLEGNVIGTITSPFCNAESNKMSWSFSATGSTQNHIVYTAKNYDLIERTGPTGEPRTAGLNGTATLTMNAAGRLTCT